MTCGISGRRLVLLDDNFLREIPYWGRRGGLLGNGLVVPWLGGLRIAYAVD